MPATSSGLQMPPSRGSDSLLDSAPRQVSPGVGESASPSLDRDGFCKFEISCWQRVWRRFLMGSRNS